MTQLELLHTPSEVRFEQFLLRVSGLDTLTGASKELLRRVICQVELAMERGVAEGMLYNTADTYPLDHRFAPGLYIREIFLPAGSLLVGRIHKDAHYNVITKGKVSVLTEEGGVELLIGPVSMVSPAGCKRVLLTHEDTWWTVTHVTELTDLDAIEAAVIAPSYTALGWDDPKAELIYSAELQNCNSPEKLEKELLWPGQW